MEQQADNLALFSAVMQVLVEYQEGLRDTKTFFEETQKVATQHPLVQPIKLEAQQAGALKALAQAERSLTEVGTAAQAAQGKIEEMGQSSQQAAKRMGSNIADGLKRAIRDGIKGAEQATGQRVVNGLSDALREGGEKGAREYVRAVTKAAEEAKAILDSGISAPRNKRVNALLQALRPAMEARGKFMQSMGPRTGDMVSRMAEFRQMEQRQREELRRQGILLRQREILQAKRFLPASQSSREELARLKAERKKISDAELSTARSEAKRLDREIEKIEQEREQNATFRRRQAAYRAAAAAREELEAQRKEMARLQNLNNLRRIDKGDFATKFGAAKTAADKARGVMERETAKAEKLKPTKAERQISERLQPLYDQRRSVGAVVERAEDLDRQMAGLNRQINTTLNKTAAELQKDLQEAKQGLTATDKNGRTAQERKERLQARARRVARIKLAADAVSQKGAITREIYEVSQRSRQYRNSELLGAVVERLDEKLARPNLGLKPDVDGPNNPLLRDDDPELYAAQKAKLERRKARALERLQRAPKVDDESRTRDRNKLRLLEAQYSSFGSAPHQQAYQEMANAFANLENIYNDPKRTGSKRNAAIEKAQQRFAAAMEGFQKLGQNTVSERADATWSKLAKKIQGENEILSRPERVQQALKEAQRTEEAMNGLRETFKDRPEIVRSLEAFSSSARELARLENLQKDAESDLEKRATQLQREAKRLGIRKVAGKGQFGYDLSNAPEAFKAAVEEAVKRQDGYLALGRQVESQKGLKNSFQKDINEGLNKVNEQLQDSYSIVRELRDPMANANPTIRLAAQEGFKQNEQELDNHVKSYLRYTQTSPEQITDFDETRREQVQALASERSEKLRQARDLFGQVRMMTSDDGRRLVDMTKSDEEIMSSVMNHKAIIGGVSATTYRSNLQTWAKQLDQEVAGLDRLKEAAKEEVTKTENQIRQLKEKTGNTQGRLIRVQKKDAEGNLVWEMNEDGTRKMRERRDEKGRLVYNTPTTTDAEGNVIPVTRRNKKGALVPVKEKIFEPIPVIEEEYYEGDHLERQRMAALERAQQYRVRAAEAQAYAQEARNVADLLKPQADQEGYLRKYDSLRQQLDHAESSGAPQAVLDQLNAQINEMKSLANVSGPTTVAATLEDRARTLREQAEKITAQTKGANGKRLTGKALTEAKEAAAAEKQALLDEAASMERRAKQLRDFASQDIVKQAADRLAKASELIESTKGLSAKIDNIRGYMGIGPEATALLTGWQDELVQTEDRRSMIAGLLSGKRFQDPAQRFNKKGEDTWSKEEAARWEFWQELQKEFGVEGGLGESKPDAQGKTNWAPEFKDGLFNRMHELDAKAKEMRSDLETFLGYHAPASDRLTGGPAQGTWVKGLVHETTPSQGYLQEFRHQALVSQMVDENGLFRPGFGAKAFENDAMKLMGAEFGRTEAESEFAKQERLKKLSEARVEKLAAAARTYGVNDDQMEMIMPLIRGLDQKLLSNDAINEAYAQAQRARGLGQEVPVGAPEKPAENPFRNMAASDIVASLRAAIAGVASQHGVDLDQQLLARSGAPTGAGVPAVAGQHSATLVADEDALRTQIKGIKDLHAGIRAEQKVLQESLTAMKGLTTNISADMDHLKAQLAAATGLEAKVGVQDGFLKAEIEKVIQGEVYKVKIDLEDGSKSAFLSQIRGLLGKGDDGVGADRTIKLAVKLTDESVAALNQKIEQLVTGGKKGVRTIQFKMVVTPPNMDWLGEFNAKITQTLDQAQGAFAGYTEGMEAKFRESTAAMNKMLEEALTPSKKVQLGIELQKGDINTQIRQMSSGELPIEKLVLNVGVNGQALKDDIRRVLEVGQRAAQKGKQEWVDVFNPSMEPKEKPFAKVKLGADSGFLLKSIRDALPEDKIIYGKSKIQLPFDKVTFINQVVDAINGIDGLQVRIGVAARMLSEEEKREQRTQKFRDSARLGKTELAFRQNPEDTILKLAEEAVGETGNKFLRFQETFSQFKRLADPIKGLTAQSNFSRLGESVSKIEEMKGILYDILQTGSLEDAEAANRLLRNLPFHTTPVKSDYDRQVRAQQTAEAAAKRAADSQKKKDDKEAQKRASDNLISSLEALQPLELLRHGLVAPTANSLDLSNKYQGFLDLRAAGKTSEAAQAADELKKLIGEGYRATSGDERNAFKILQREMGKELTLALQAERERQKADSNKQRRREERSSPEAIEERIQQRLFSAQIRQTAEERRRQEQMQMWKTGVMPEFLTGLERYADGLQDDTLRVAGTRTNYMEREQYRQQALRNELKLREDMMRLQQAGTLQEMIDADKRLAKRERELELTKEMYRGALMRGQTVMRPDVERIVDANDRVRWVYAGNADDHAILADGGTYDAKKLRELLEPAHKLYNESQIATRESLKAAGDEVNARLHQPVEFADFVQKLRSGERPDETTDWLRPEHVAVAKSMGLEYKGGMDSAEEVAKRNAAINERIDQMLLHQTSRVNALEARYSGGMNRQGVVMSMADADRYSRAILDDTFGDARKAFNNRLKAEREQLIEAGEFEQAQSPALRRRTRDQFLGEFFNTQMVDEAGKLSKIHESMVKLLNLETEELEDQLRILRAMDQAFRPEFERRQQYNAVASEEAGIQNLADFRRQAIGRRNARFSPYANMGRALAYNFGGMGIGFLAAQQVRMGMIGAMEMEKTMAEIQGVLSGGTPEQAANIREGVATTATTYGANLLETAGAAKILAQSGMNAAEVMTELDYTMLGMRGMGMSIEQMQELQIAIRAVTGEVGNTGKVLEKLTKIESSYAVTGQDLAEMLKVFSPVAQQLSEDVAGIGDAFDYSIGMATVMIETLRITGKQAGNSLKFIMARLMSPEILRSLQEDFGVQLSQKGGKELLPLPDLIQSINDTYVKTKADDPAKAQRLLAQLAGGRRVNEAIALFDNMDRAMKIAEESSLAFGNAERRAALVMNTMSAQMENLRTSFHLFVDSLLESSGAGWALKKMMEGLAFTMKGFDGQGGGFGAFALLAGGGLGIAELIRGLVTFGSDLKMARLANKYGMGKEVPGGRVRVSDIRRARQMTEIGEVVAEGTLAAATAKQAGIFGKLGQWIAGVAPWLGTAARGLMTFAANLHPVTKGLLLLGTALAAVTGFKMWGDKNERERPMTRITPEQLGVRESAQYKEYQELATQLEIPMQSPQTLYEATMKALRGQIRDPETGQMMGNMQQLLSDYGYEGDMSTSWLKMAQDLEKTGDTNREHWQKLREEGSEAFLKDLEKMIPKLKDIEDKAERIKIATRLIGQARWSSNAMLSELGTQVASRQQSQFETVMKNLELMQKNGFWDFGKQNDLNARIAVRPTVDAQAVDEFRGELYKIFNNLFEDEGLAKSLTQGMNTSFLTGVAEEINSTGRSRGQALTYTEGLNVFFRRLQETRNSTAAQYGNVLKVNEDGQLTQTTGSLYDFMIGKAAKARVDMLNSSGVMTNLGVATDVTGSEASTRKELGSRLAQFFTDYSKQVELQAKARGLANSPDAQLSAAVNALTTDDDTIERAMLDLEGLGGALNKFKSIILDMILDFEQAQATIAFEGRFAQGTGNVFDAPAAQFQALKGFAQGLGTLESQYNREIITLQNQLSTLEGGAVKQMLKRLQDRKVIMPDEVGSDTELNEQLGDSAKQVKKILQALQQGKKELEQSAQSVFSILPDSEEGGALRTRLSGLLGKLSGSPDKLVEDADYRELEAIVTRAAKLRQDEMDAQARRNAALDRELDITTKLRDLKLAAIRTDLTLGEQAQQRTEANAAALQQQLEIIQKREGIREEEKAAQSREAVHQFFVNEMYERQRTLIESQNALRQQGIENMKQGLSGVGATLKNLDLWGQLVRDGEDKAEAVRGLVRGFLQPLTEVFYGRSVDNFMEHIFRKVQDIGGLKLFETPESSMRENIELAGFSAAQSMYDAIVAGGTQVSAIWRQMDGAPITPGKPQRGVPVPSKGVRLASGGSTLDGLDTGMMAALGLGMAGTGVITAASAAKAYGIDPKLAQQILDSAKKHGIPAHIAFGLVSAESQFKPNARGADGEYGLTQLMPATARGLGVNNPLDPAQNLEGGFRHLSGLGKKYDGNWELALTEYNRGVVAMNRARKNGVSPLNGYAARVMAAGNRLSMTPEVVATTAAPPVTATAAGIRLASNVDPLTNLSYVPNVVGEMGPAVQGLSAESVRVLKAQQETLAQKNKDFVAKIRRQEMMSQAGMMVGSLGGTMVGGGGQMAQLFSGLGSTGGAMLGNMVLPGVGGFIGGALGGMGGGLLGKLLDPKNDDSVQVQQLQAIERAQRETITAIESQTSSLLRPESRLINMPTDFNLPAYQPAFGGGDTYNDVSVSINITGDMEQGITLDDVKKAAKDALKEALNDGGKRKPR